MRFEFATANRIIFGQGLIKQAAPIAASFGRRALIVTGSTSDQAASLIEQLKPQQVEAVTFSVVR